MFTGIKDRFSSGVARSMLAARLDRYGELTDLRIRSRERTIRVELALQGEEKPVWIEVERYRITGTRGEPSITVEKATASRVWLQNLLEDLVVGRPMAVPAAVLFALGRPED